jgi:hypothetical protein
MSDCQESRYYRILFANEFRRENPNYFEGSDLLDLVGLIFDPRTYEIIKNPVRLIGYSNVFEKATLEYCKKWNYHPIRNEFCENLEWKDDKNLESQLKNVRNYLKENKDSIGGILLKHDFFRISSQIHQSYHKLAQFINFDNITSTLPILQIVLTGDEGCGKSNVLERLSFCPVFPRGILGGAGTRCIVRLQCRYSPNPIPKLSITTRHYKINPITQKRIIIESNETEEENERIINMAENIPEIVRATMKSFFDSSEPEHSRSITKEHEIILTVTGSEFPNIDFIDCPGLTSQTDNHDIDNAKEILQYMIKEEAERSIFIIAVQQGKYKQSNTAKLFISEQPQLLSQSILVFTNMDNAPTISSLEDSHEVPNYQKYIHELSENSFYIDLLSLENNNNNNNNN